MSQEKLKTKEEARAYIEKHCYGIDGMLDQNKLRRIIENLCADLPAGEIFGLYGQMLYKPSKDQRLQRNFE